MLALASGASRPAMGRAAAAPQRSLASSSSSAAAAAEKVDAADAVADAAAQVLAPKPLFNSGLSPKLYASLQAQYTNFTPAVAPDAPMPTFPVAGDYHALHTASGALGQQPLSFAQKPNAVEAPGYLTEQFDELRSSLNRIRERFESTLAEEAKADSEVQRKARYTPPMPADDAFINPYHYVSLAKMGTKTNNPQLTAHAVAEFQKARTYLNSISAERNQFSRNGQTVPAAIAAMPQYQELNQWLSDMQSMSVTAAEQAAAQISAIDALQEEFDAEEQNVPYETVLENLEAHPEWVEEFDEAHRGHRWFELAHRSNPAPSEEEEYGHH